MCSSAIFISQKSAFPPKKAIKNPRLNVFVMTPQNPVFWVKVTGLSQTFTQTRKFLHQSINHSQVFILFILIDVINEEN